MSLSSLFLFIGAFRDSLMLFQQVNGQLFFNGFRVSKLVFFLHGLSLTERYRIDIQKTRSCFLYDALCHFHRQILTAVTFVCYSNSFRQDAVSF